MICSTAPCRRAAPSGTRLEPSDGRLPGRESPQARRPTWMPPALRRQAAQPVGSARQSTPSRRPPLRCSSGRIVFDSALRHPPCPPVDHRGTAPASVVRAPLAAANPKRLVHVAHCRPGASLDLLELCTREAGLGHGVIAGTQMHAGAPDPEARTQHPDRARFDPMPDHRAGQLAGSRP